MEINKVTETHVVEHRLEEIFGIESGTTVIERDVLYSDTVESELYDEKDKEIDEQFQNIYDVALTAFADNAGLINTDEDPKNSAKCMEVANSFLNTALAAAKEKANLKKNKDNLKQNIAKSNAPITNNNLIMTRGELFAMISQSKGK